MLKFENCVVNYGAVEALRGVSLEIHKGEIVTLIGANGAGKTTTVMSLCGMVTPVSGNIIYQGQCLKNVSSAERLKLGMACSPEGRRIFPRMTVFENLQMGCLVRAKERFSHNLEKAFTLFPRLKERQMQFAGTMSGGEQQMLAIARALMSEPELLLLDEPSLGLAPLIVQQIFQVIKALNEKENMTILLVEQNANLALKAAHRGYVLSAGQLVKTGTGEELLKDPDIRAAYLEGGH
jgi:branched-chain amino acid transport system ATP-binding protein